MTEYTSSPAAIEQYRSARARTADWVTVHHNDPSNFLSPSVPPSLIDDSDDGMSTPSDSDFSSHSVPPRMMLKYPDGRPDIPISESAGYSDETRTSSRDRDRRKELDGWSGSSPYAASPTMPPPHPSYASGHAATRSRATSHPHSSFPPFASQPSASTVLMVPPPPQASYYPAPETIQIHPSGSGPYSPYTPVDPQGQGSGSQRSKSMHSSRSKRSTPSHPPLQMIYTPPIPPALPSNPVSPARSHFSQQQQPREILAPSPIYAYSNKPEITDSERIPEPDLEQTPTPGPGDAIRERHAQLGSHSSSRLQAPANHTHTLSKSSSGSGGRGNKPPSIVYAPSKHSSSASFNYGPPVITKHPPHPAAVPMQRTPSQHPSAHLPESSRHSSRQRAHSPSRSQPPPTKKVPTSQPLIPSYSDPTYNRDHYTTGASRYYTTVNHGGHKSSSRHGYDRYGRAPSPDERGHRGGGYTYDDRQRDSRSSGSTYYVIPS